MPDDPDSATLHIEYKAPGGSRWRIEDGSALMSEFGITNPDQLPAWHACLVGQGRSWEVVRRYFGVGDILAKEPTQQVPPDAIAKELGLTFADVDRELDHAIAHWNTSKSIEAIADDVVAESEEEKSLRRAGQSRSFAMSEALSDQEIDHIIEQHRFDDITDPVERRQVATRLIEFDHLLAQAEDVSFVYTAIRQELDLAYLNRELSEARKKTGEPGAGSRKEVVGLIKDRDIAMGKLKDTLEALGATQAQRPAAQKRVDFQDSIGYVMGAIQKYYAEEDNALIDGMHTAAEINFLLEPIAERPIQLDPMVVIEVFHAQQTLWEDEFKGQRINRNTARRLRTIFGQVVEELNTDNGIPVRSLEDDDDQANAEEIEQLESSQAVESPVAPGESVASPIEAGSALAQQQQAWAAAQREAGDSFTAG